MTPSPASGAQVSIGEILLWQGKFRRNFAAIVGLIALAFKGTGVIRADSLIAHVADTRTALGVALVGLVLYLVLIELVQRRIRQAGSAGRALLYTVLVGDFVVLFTIILALTPPVQFARALIIAVFLVQFARMYFGLRATVVSVVAASVGYVSLIVGATRVGVLAEPAEQFWNLAIFLMGALFLGGFQGQVSGRLGRVLALFERAQDGDFDHAYDDSLDRMPDPITMIGRAFNRMRVRLEAIVLTDALSGCFNRRGFEQLCAREVSRAIRGKHPVAMLAIDVDHFKGVNDEFGHLTGDEVLREMGKRLRDTARLGDVVARIGGEEFSVLAPDTNTDGAQILADRIQAAFRGKPFVSLGGVRDVSISIGVASAIADNDQIVSSLIARADEALYVAKRNGRDRSQMWEPGLRAFDGALPGRRSIEIGAMQVTKAPDS